jgi:hypothetical protein
MIMMTPLPNKNLSTKTAIDLIKLSTCLFQGRMKKSNLKTCGIMRLDGMSNRIRSTLFSKNT